MKRSINLHEFRDAFANMGRGDNFSYEGLGILFEGLESVADETGEEYELDVIALCCEFSEESDAEIIANYGIEINSKYDFSAREELLEYLNERTWVLGSTEDTIIYASF